MTALTSVALVARRSASVADVTAEGAPISLHTTTLPFSELACGSPADASNVTAGLHSAMTLEYPHVCSQLRHPTHDTVPTATIRSASRASAPWLPLTLAVADEVARKHPGRTVGTLAYAYGSKPPKTLRPRDNVQIRWCASKECFIHPLDDPTCPMNAPKLAELQGWSKITPNLYVWSYQFNHDRRGFQLPLPNLRWADRNCWRS